MATIWVQATTTDRKVIVSEYNELHPGNHEAWIVGYPDRVEDTGEPRPGNLPIEVGDTGLVRQRIATGELIQVDRPITDKERRAAEKAEAERIAKLNQGGQNPPAT